jgi:membrane protease YdiL (CAAX protease family)
MKFIRRYEVWFFLTLLVVVNFVFVTSVVEGVLPQGVYGLGRFALLGLVLFGLIFLVRGWAGVFDVLRPMLEWRRSPLLYLFAIGWTLLVCLVVLTGKGWLTGDYLSLHEIENGLAKLAHPKLLVTLLVSSFIGEIVWVSYAVRKLSEQFTPYISALVVGLAWTLWWLPMSIYDFGIIPELPLVALLFNQMGVAAMCAFVYHHTRSGFLILLMQCVFNSTILVFPVTPTEGGPPTYWAFALTYFAMATILFICFGPRPLRGMTNPKMESSALPTTV